MSTDPCMDAALDHVRSCAPGHIRRDERLWLSTDDHYRLSADLRKKAVLWEAIAKDLAESGSAIVLSLGRGQVPSAVVMGLWYAACDAYDAAQAGKEEDMK